MALAFVPAGSAGTLFFRPADVFGSAPPPPPPPPPPAIVTNYVRVVMEAKAANAAGVTAEVFPKLSSGRAGDPLFSQGFSDSPTSAGITFPVAVEHLVTVDIQVPANISVSNNQVVRVSMQNVDAEGKHQTFLIDGVVI